MKDSFARNRRISAEDKESVSMRHRLDEVQHWFNGVLRLNSEYGGAPTTHEDTTRRTAGARLLASNKEYVVTEAARLDSEYGGEPKLVHHILNLSYILEHEPEALSSETVQRDVQTRCTEALERIAQIEAMITL